MMKEKQNNLFTIIFLAGILLMFSAVNLIIDVLFFSGNAGKLWAEEKEEIAAGTTAEKYEKFFASHIVNKEKYEKIRDNTEYFLGKRERSGLWIGKNGYYFEQHLAEDYSEDIINRSLEFLKLAAEKYHAQIMLVPTADGIWPNKLPLYAFALDQKEYLNRVQQTIGDEYYTDVLGALERRRNEDIFYKTDSHWTQLGAYYGYYAWWRTSGKLLPYHYDPSHMKMVKEEIVGNYEKGLSTGAKKDYLKVFTEAEKKTVSVVYDGYLTGTGYFREDFLDRNNPGGYILGDGYGLVEVTTGYERAGTLLVIRDSFANNLVPLLAPHYGKIYLVDPQYAENAEELIEKYADEKTDVLLLYSVPGFLEQFK